MEHYFIKGVNMRYLVILAILFLAIPCYGKQIVIETTNEEYDAVDAIVVSPQEWIQHAWNNKARKCMERVIDSETNLRGEKLTKEEKIDKIKEIKPKKRTE